MLNKALAILALSMTVCSCQNTDIANGPTLVIESVPPAIPTDDCPAPPLAQFPVRVNEVMVENDGFFADESGNFSPWVELYNPSADEVLVSGAFLSDDLGDPQKWEIPCVPDGYTIPPQGFLVIFLDGDTLNEEDLHAPFTLQTGGEITLILNDGSDLIEFDSAPLAVNRTVGRFPDGAGNVAPCPLPTPLAENTQPVLESFLRGDADGDGALAAGDLDALLAHLKAESVQKECLDRLDANDDGTIDVSDASVLAKAIAGKSQLPAPSGDAGVDPTEDDLPSCLEVGGG